MKSFLFGALLAVAIAVSPNPGMADCRSDEQRLMAEMQQWSQRMQSQNQGFCLLARDAQQFFRRALQFYERCPINDPNGQMRQYSREMIQWGRDTEAATCSG